MTLSNLISLNELIDIKHGYAFPGRNIVSEEQERILVTPGHFEIGGGFRYNHKKYFDSPDYKNGYELSSGDLIVTMTDLSKTGDTLGYGAIVPDIPNKILLHNQRIGKVEFKNNKLDKGFCHYLLRSQKYRNHVLSNCSGSTVKHTSPRKILEFEFELPNVADQKVIAYILGTLDDKIELNQKMRQTLEEIAKAICKSWFVDFDPVRAKAEGRPTGLPSEISDLFPDELVGSEIGERPKGWEAKSLRDCDLEIESGRRPKGGIDKNIADGVPSVGAESIATIGKFDFSKVKFVTDEFSSSVKKGWVKNYDVALYKDGGKPGLFIPRVGLYGDAFPFEKFLVNEHIFLLRSKLLGQFFLYYLISSPQILNQLIERGSAKAAQPGLNQEELQTASFICPTPAVMNKFNTIATPIVQKQLVLGRETLALAELRDTLLPKLISGELRIPDAEKFLKEAGI